MEGDNFPSEKTLKQRLFSKDELHHLNVTQVGKLTVSDLLDCIVECLKNSLCLSINMAAFKGAEGKLWCELLSSDKYRDIKNYKGNMSSHYFSILVITFSKCSNLSINSRARSCFDQKRFVNFTQPLEKKVKMTREKLYLQVRKLAK